MPSYRRSVKMKVYSLVVQTSKQASWCQIFMKMNTQNKSWIFSRFSTNVYCNMTRDGFGWSVCAQHTVYQNENPKGLKNIVHLALSCLKEWSRTNPLVAQATSHEGSKFRWHRQGLCSRDGIWDDQVALGGVHRAGEESAGTRRHLLGDQHGPLRQLVRVWTGLLPYWDLLG